MDRLEKIKFVENMFKEIGYSDLWEELNQSQKERLAEAIYVFYKDVYTTAYIQGALENPDFLSSITGEKKTNAS